MGASRYISSGLIEAYIGGLAVPQEVQEVEAAMGQYPEVATVVDDYQLGMEHYVMLHAVPPPPVVKVNIFRIIAEEEQGKVQATDTDENQVTTDTPVRKLYVNSIWRWTAAAAILLLLGSLYFNYIYFARYSDYKVKYEALAESHSSLAAETNTYRARLDLMEQSLSLVKNPSMKMVKMPGTKAFPEAQATVYWNQASKEVFVMVNNLPTPDADKQFQLWAIVDGKPVDMGVFDAGTNSTDELLQKMKSIDNAEMFAVTLEKKGGSPVPTMDQMYVAGKPS